MKRLLLTLLAAFLAVVALLPPGPTGATNGMTVLLGQAELEQAFAELVRGRSSLPPGDLTISHFTATPESIGVPPGPREFRVVSRGQVKGLGKQTMVTDILVNGETSGRVTMSGDLALQGYVVCATRTLARRSIIAAGDLERVRRDLTMLGPDLVTDPSQVIGKELSTTLQPGAPLYGRFIKEPEMVKRGDIVSILASTDLLTITVPGQIKSAGAKGDRVKVKNLMSRREICAKVIGPKTVQAEL